MAACTVLKSQLMQMLHGGVGLRVQFGSAAFPSTDATGTLPVPAFTEVHAVFLTKAAAGDSDEILHGPDPDANGVVTPSSGAITVGRTGGSPVDALEFFFYIVGR